MKHLSKLLVVCLPIMSAHLIWAAPKAASTSRLPCDIKVVDMKGIHKDMVEIAVGSPDHKTLVTAVGAAGLVETLQGAGPYTLFAPTDAAFGKLPAGTVEGLIKPEKKEVLKSILEHHAAAPGYSPEILCSMKEIDMVDGPKIQLEIKERKLFADGVEVVAMIKAKNGYVYIVNTVLLAK